MRACCVLCVVCVRVLCVCASACVSACVPVCGRVGVCTCFVCCACVYVREVEDTSACVHVLMSG